VRKLLFMQAWKPALSRCTRSAHILVAVFLSAQALSGLNASAMVRSTTVLVKFVVVLHLAEWIASQFQFRTEISQSIQAQFSLVQPLVSTQQVKKPKDRTASVQEDTNHHDCRNEQKHWIAHPAYFDRRLGSLWNFQLPQGP
jgi:hypothetical protein